VSDVSVSWTRARIFDEDFHFVDATLGSRSALLHAGVY